METRAKKVYHAIATGLPVSGAPGDEVSLFAQVARDGERHGVVDVAGLGEGEGVVQQVRTVRCT